MSESRVVLPPDLQAELQRLLDEASALDPRYHAAVGARVSVALRGGDLLIYWNVFLHCAEATVHSLRAYACDAQTVDSALAELRASLGRGAGECVCIECATAREAQSVQEAAHA